MTTVLHRNTTLTTTFEVVDDEGNIIETEETKLNLSTLTEDDFTTSLKALKEVWAEMQKEYGEDKLNLGKLVKKVEAMDMRIFKQEKEQTKMLKSIEETLKNMLPEKTAEESIEKPTKE
jgi:hypothetical protein